MTPGRRDQVVERVLSLCSVLHAAPRGLTWPEIAEAVSLYEDTAAGRKAFQRDRAMLESAGLRFVPGTYTDTGYRYRLDSWDRAPELTPGESAAVRLAALALEESSAAKSSQLAAERLTASTLGGSFSFTSWSPRLPGDSNLLEMMSEAIAAQDAVSFSYVNARGESSERTVWPWTVYVHGSDWYLIAYDLRRQEPRIFRFGRITQAQAVPAEHSPRADPHALEERPERIAALIRGIPTSGDEQLRVALEPGTQPWIRWAGEAQGQENGLDIVALEPRHRASVLDQALSDGRGLTLLGPEGLLEDWRASLARLAHGHREEAELPEDLAPGRLTRRTLAPQDRVYRSFTLLRLLSEESPQRLSDLADRLGAKEDALESDLWALSLSTGPDTHAAPFSVEIDEDGWVSLAAADSAFTDSVPPVKDIIPLVAALGHLARSADPDGELGTAIASAQVKLLTTGQSADLAESLLAVSRQDAAPDERTRTILEAISSRRLISFPYFKPDEEPRLRTVLPARLLTEHGRDYLLAWEPLPDSGENDDDGPSAAAKHFRLDRTGEITLGEVTPGDTADFSPSADSLSVDTPRWGTVRRRRSRDKTAVLGAQASPEHSARELLERFGARNIRESASSGELIGEVNVHSGHFPREIMAARGYLRVLSPSELRHRVLRMTTDMQKTSP